MNLVPNLFYSKRQWWVKIKQCLEIVSWSSWIWTYFICFFNHLIISAPLLQFNIGFYFVDALEELVFCLESNLAVSLHLWQNNKFKSSAANVWKHCLPSDFRCFFSKLEPLPSPFLLAVMSEVYGKVKVWKN